MKNIHPQYHGYIHKQQVISKCLALAHERFPGQTLEYCGSEESWEDCLTCFHNDQGQLEVLMYYNIGANTHAVTVTVNTGGAK